MCIRSYLIECKNCGVIYRSRQHWYGNKNPEHTAVKTENKHVWPSVSYLVTFNYFNLISPRIFQWLVRTPQTQFEGWLMELAV